MKREYLQHYSEALHRDMHMLSYGESGIPLIAIPCQDGMCDNWESFQMQDTLAEYIENGTIRLFCLDTVDRESWSDKDGDKAHRSWMQECYYHYLVDEAYPFIQSFNATGKLPIMTGFSLGATHSVIVFLRRPELFSGAIALSGVYDASYFWGDWSDSNLYNNSPVHFLPGMAKDHPLISVYNQKRLAICVGQGAWEDEGIRTAAILRDLFQEKGIHGWVEFWGYDVNHDWPWWRKQIHYFLPWVLEGTK